MAAVSVWVPVSHAGGRPCVAEVKGSGQEQSGHGHRWVRTLRAAWAPQGAETLDRHRLRGAGPGRGSVRTISAG